MPRSYGVSGADGGPPTLPKGVRLLIQVRLAPDGKWQNRRCALTNGVWDAASDWVSGSLGASSDGLYDENMERVAGPPHVTWGGPWSQLAVPPPPAPIADANRLVEALGSQVGSSSVHTVAVDARKPRYGAWPKEASALREQGIDLPERPYRHQAVALRSILAGKHTAIATGTASGKTICYQIPILARVGGDAHAGALYVSPAKALCTDQLASWSRLFGLNSPDGPWVTGEVGGHGVSVVRYDRDTKGEGVSPRDAARATVVLTNSSMLHWMLAHGRTWKDLLGRLALVVIDEVHTARGVAGANLAWVLRRLRRLVHFYSGAAVAPQFVLCSATIGNPGQLGAQLIGDGRAVSEVRDDASGQGRRLFVSWTPPVAGDSGRRTAVVPGLVDGLLTRPEGPAQTVVFHRSRPEANLTARQCADQLRRNGREDLASALNVYISNRSGQSKEGALASLQSGSCPAVFATSALELGVDIGDLSAAVIVGIPHSRAGFRQMAGRVGRRADTEALVLYVPRDNPLDDWYARQEHFGADLAQADPEDVVMDPDNRVIADRHLAAASVELGLDPSEDAPFLGKEHVARVLSDPEFAAKVRERDDGRHYWEAKDEDPHKRINVLAARGTAQVQVRVKSQGEPIGETDNWSAQWMLFPGAVYDDGVRDTYVVQSLHLGDLEGPVRTAGSGAVAWVRRATLEEQRCFTVAERESSIEALGTRRQEGVGMGRLRFEHGDVKVSTRLTGSYWLVPRGEPGRASAHATRQRKNLPQAPTAVDSDGREIEYPTLALETEALWFAVPSSCIDELAGVAGGPDRWTEQQVATVASAIHGAEHLICKMTAVLDGFCDDDISGLSVANHPQLTGPGMFLYENCPGGSGLIRRLLDGASVRSVFEAARDTVRTCRCDGGCPRCVLDRLCGNANDLVNKDGARLVLDELVEALRPEAKRRRGR